MKGLKQERAQLAILIATALFCCLVPALAFADENPPGGTPSTGTVIAAALETAGYVGQAQILQQLKQMLQELGALIYVGVIISVLLLAVVAGNFQKALWLLIGPPLFFFLLRPTTGAKPVEWRFGAFRDSGDLQLVLGDAEIQANGGQAVSWFFHSYNVLISDTVQQLIELFTKKEVKPQMMFMTRQSIMDDLFASQINEPGLKQLISVLSSQCTVEMNAARLIAFGERNPYFKETNDYKAAVPTYCELMKFPNKAIRDSATQDYLRALLGDDFTGGFESVSCENMWLWMFEGVKQTAFSVKERAMVERVNHQAPAEVLQKIVKDIETKLTEWAPDEKAPASTFKCPGGGTVAQTNGNELIPMIFTGWLIQKVFKADARSTFVDEPFEDSGINNAPLNSPISPGQSRQLGYEIQRRYRADQLAEASRYEAYTVAKMLPYVQGAGLYMLAVTFPFFALMILMPGLGGAFLMWLALWAWLKSWDLGWSLVMIADDILWSLMPHATYFRVGANGAGSVLSDPITVLEAAFGGDYAYNLSTYYLLVGSMITAVPILSAHAVLGSKKAIAGIFVDGIKTVGQRFGQVAEHWLGALQNAGIDRQREMAAYHEGKEKIDKLYDQLRHISKDNQWGGSIRAGVAMGERVAAEANFNRAGAKALKAHSDEIDKNGAESGLPADTDAPANDAMGQAVGARQAAQGQFSQAIQTAASQNLAVKTLLGGNLENLPGLMKEAFATGGQSLIDLSKQVDTAPADIAENGQASGGTAMPWQKDYGMPTPELEEMVRQMAANAYVADFRGGLGELALVGASVGQLNLNGLEALSNMKGTDAQIFAALNPGGSNVLGKSLMAIGGMGVAMSKDAIQMKRQVNAMAADIMIMASQHYYYESMKSNEAAFYDQLRAGVSGYRVEHWSTPDSPIDIAYKAHKSAEVLQRTSENIKAQTITNMILGTVNAATEK